LVVSVCATLAGCGSGGATTPRPGSNVAPVPAAGPGDTPVADPTALYRQMGLIAAGAPLPFTGAVGFLATVRSDSTHVVFALSLATASLAFERDGDRFNATYGVSLTMRRDGAMVRQVDATEPVRVATYRETLRLDESIIFQQVLTVPPGIYTLAVRVRDERRGVTGGADVALRVPALPAGSLATPIPFYESRLRLATDSLPRLLMRPRASAVFGRDSLLSFYVEGYGSGEAIPVQLAVRADDRVIFRDSSSVPRSGAIHAGVLSVPISRVGIGAAEVLMWRGTGGDTVRSPIFVGFGEDLPAVTYADMLIYLRYFASPAQLRTLRDAAPDARATVWQEFLKDTDPFPQTGEHEGLREYFARLRQANDRFREEGTPGWRTDRGVVFLQLGEPDAVTDDTPTNFGDRGRRQLWEYRRHNLRVLFVDQSGFGRWRMTQQSESDVAATVARLRGDR
jgi:GWxTD domain-containing protein